MSYEPDHYHQTNPPTELKRDVMGRKGSKKNKVSDGKRSDTATCYANDLSSKCAASIDAIIAESIRQQLGEMPPLDSLQGRLKRVRCMGEEFETLTLDGQPILELHPLEITTKKEGDAVKMVATQPYRTFKHNANSDRTA